jgi:hypothetical protein
LFFRPLLCSNAQQRILTHSSLKREQCGEEYQEAVSRMTMTALTSFEPAGAASVSGQLTDRPPQIAAAIDRAGERPV